MPRSRPRLPYKQQQQAGSVACTNSEPAAAHLVRVLVGEAHNLVLDGGAVAGALGVHPPASTRCDVAWGEKSYVIASGEKEAEGAQARHSGGCGRQQPLAEQTA